MKVLEDRTGSKLGSPPSLGSFLEDFFSRLDNAAVSYCVLHSYQGLPEYVENDIDLLVDQRHLKAFRQCILTAAENSGWVLFKNPIRYAFQSFWFKDVYECGFVQIDVWSVLHYKGVYWAGTKQILNRIVRMRQFFIPQPSAEAVILLLKDVIQTGRTKAIDFEKIYETATNDQFEFQDFLKWSLGCYVGGWLFEEVQKQAWQEIEHGKIKIRLAILGRAFCRNPLGLFLNFIRFLWGHLWARLAKPAGMFVVLFGPDGSGKSAVAEKLQESLKPAFRQRQYYHGRFGMIPRLRDCKDAVVRAIGRPVQIHTDEMAQYYNGTKHSLGRVLIHVLYYSLDYLLGHWVIGRSQAMGDLIIFDRYFYDWFIQSYFQRTPRWILPVLKFIYPRPDLVVYLSNSSEVIHKRKPELSIEQIEQQSRRCQEIVCDLPYGITILTESSLQEVTQKVSEKIVQIMVARY